MNFPTVEQFVGHTPLVRLQRMVPEGSGTILVKLEGNNPAGSVKDRPALSMIQHAEARGEIRPGDTLIEATSGNTGIALAMTAALKGYRLVLIMPENMSTERRASMQAYGAELVLVSQDEGMEGARDLAQQMEREGRGKVLDQFSNPDNPLAHYETTGPEIWHGTDGGLTHFVSAMGTTGTIMGTSRFLKERNPEIRIVGVQPAEGAKGGCRDGREPGRGGGNHPPPRRGRGYLLRCLLRGCGGLGAASGRRPARRPDRDNHM